MTEAEQPGGESQTAPLVEFADSQGQRAAFFGVAPAVSGITRPPREEPPVTVENWPDDVDILEDADLAGYRQGYGTAITVISREQAQAILDGKLIDFGVQGEYGAILRLWRPEDEQPKAEHDARIAASRARKP